jgi:hypothetical protein
MNEQDPEPNVCTTLNGSQRPSIDHRGIIHPGNLRLAPREALKFQPDEPLSNPGRFIPSGLERDRATSVWAPLSRCGAATSRRA